MRLDGGGRAVRNWLGPPSLPEEPEDGDEDMPSTAEDTVSLREECSVPPHCGSPLGEFTISDHTVTNT